MHLFSVTTVAKCVYTAMLKAPYKQGRLRSSRTLKRELGSLCVGRIGGVEVAMSFALCQQLFSRQALPSGLMGQGTDSGKAWDSVSLTSPHRTPGKWAPEMSLLTKGEGCFLPGPRKPRLSPLSSPALEWETPPSKARHLLADPHSGHGPPQMSTRHN